ncbi:MAG: winged helix-turn-helix domain-containing protein [Planctomycetes bacterium]|nr:winged helix-turn-helix domain-containing protein [Planctomycetota bacterium]
MATAAPISHVEHVGETAGVVWKILHNDGPLTMAKLVKAVGRPRDVVMQALGWLAREEKISIEEDGRSRIVSLR